MKIIGAVDIGGTKIAVAAVTEEGKILNRFDCPTVPEQGFAPAMERTRALLHEAARQARIRYAGIGVGSAGPVDPFTGIYGEVGTLPGWMGGDLAAELGGEFGVPVAVENDADAAALAEANWGAAKGSSRFIYVTVSTGIGAAYIFSGGLYRGLDGVHPEPGHIILDASSGPLCYCGAHGCWEVLAAGPALAAWMRQQRPESNLSAAEICALARQGDEVARRGVKRTAYYIGLGLANLVTMFAPDTIAIGGGLMRSADLLLDPARDVVRTLCTQVPVEKTRITLASLGGDTGLAGAAQAWLHRYDGRNAERH